MRRLVALPLVLAATLASARAHAADTAVCLNASEKGQRARTAGKLREAREQFLVCGGEGCPAIVRRDCSQWQVELVNLTPSVVFGAKDRQGRDLFDVVVSMDGEPLVKNLDGKSVGIDPGPHTFKFEMQGHAPVLERALVKEGEKTRVIAVTIGADPGSSIGPDPSNSGGSSSDHGPKRTNERRHSALPWVVVGVGAAGVVAGLVVVLTAPKLPPNCLVASQSCTRPTNESNESFKNDQDQAGLSESQPRLGFIIGGVGLGVLAGGLLWHFLEPTGPATTALRVSPWAGPGSSGMLVGGSF